MIHSHTTRLIIGCLTNGPKTIEELRIYIRFWYNIQCETCATICSRIPTNEQYLPEQLNELLLIEAVVYNEDDETYELPAFRSMRPSELRTPKGKRRGSDSHDETPRRKMRRFAAMSTTQTKFK